MAKKAVGPKWYEVLELSYIGDRLYQVGDKVQYDGEAGSNLAEIVEPGSTSDDTEDKAAE